jgi:hypothetical protein
VKRLPLCGFGLAALFAGSIGAHGGSYAVTTDCDQVVGGFCAQGTDTNGFGIGAFVIMHPPGYTGQTTLTVDVCTSPLNPELAVVTQQAVAKWAALSPMTGNCWPFCPLAEEHPDPPDPGGPPIFPGLDAQTVILHELGHALGLDHPNLLFVDPTVESGGALVNTSFAAGYDGAVTGVLVGADSVRGTRDDFFDDLLGSTAVNVNWFREVDNDPFVVDSAVIDINHFSRSTNTVLPPGSTWAVMANYCAGFAMGYQRTQAVMYSYTPPATRYRGLSADDANMLKMASTGEDRIAGNADDYTLVLNWVPSCTGADIEVGFGDLGGVNGPAGETALAVDPTFASPAPPLARHYTVRGSPGLPIQVVLNEARHWDIGNLVLAYDFENGDLSGWDGALPALTGREIAGLPYFCTIPPPGFRVSAQTGSN